MFVGRHLNFRVITLREPPKAEMIRFLEENSAKPTRCARVQVVIRNESGVNQLFELVIDLEQAVVTEKHQLDGKHSYIDAAYMQAVERVCMADKRIQKEIELLELPSEATVCVEPWAYATDGMNNMSERTTMVCERALIVVMGTN